MKKNRFRATLKPAISLQRCCKTWFGALRNGAVQDAACWFLRHLCSDIGGSEETAKISNFEILRKMQNIDPHAGREWWFEKRCKTSKSTKYCQTAARIKISMSSRGVQEGKKCNFGGKCEIVFLHETSADCFLPKAGSNILWCVPGGPGGAPRKPCTQSHRFYCVFFTFILTDNLHRSIWPKSFCIKHEGL